MQGSDGGWGAYDKDNNRVVFNYIPFADHGRSWIPVPRTLLADVWRCLAIRIRQDSSSRWTRALAFLKYDQEEDGSWYGRWGVNYIYGTWSVLAGSGPSVKIFLRPSFVGRFLAGSETESGRRVGRVLLVLYR